MISSSAIKYTHASRKTYIYIYESDWSTASVYTNVHTEHIV